MALAGGESAARLTPCTLAARPPGGSEAPNSSGSGAERHLGPNSRRQAGAVSLTLAWLAATCAVSSDTVERRENVMHSNQSPGREPGEPDRLQRTQRPCENTSHAVHTAPQHTHTHTHRFTSHGELTRAEHPHNCPAARAPTSSWTTLRSPCR